MTPIRDTSDLRVGLVLYHSAFGFARVAAVETDWIVLQWTGGGDNLPERVPHDVLHRVYAACRPDGFFDRAVNQADALRSELAERPAAVLQLLLADLHGPQREHDLREWVVARGFLPEAAFEHWWGSLAPRLASDPAFVVTPEGVALRAPEDAEPVRSRLQNPLLPAGRRLDLALDHRDVLTRDEFLHHALLAWRTGGTQVKDLALAALKAEPPSRILAGLLSAGPDGIEAIIHAIRRAGWAPTEVPDSQHRDLVRLVLRALDDGGTLDPEGRLAATLVRWPSPRITEALYEAAGSAEGKRLLRACFGSLPPRRAESLALELTSLALAAHDDDTSQWLGGEALGFALVGADEMVERVAADHPQLAEWFRQSFKTVEDRPERVEYDDTTDETLHTAEIDLSDMVSAPMPIGRLPARSGASLVGLGLAMARALSVHHKEGRVVNPTAFTVKVLPNETMEAEPTEDATNCPRPLLEPESPAADVYAASVLLLEALIGKPWPRNLPASRAIPYLRTTIPLLPPSALAPLDAGLHPDPARRPADGLAWLARWQSAAMAEESRAYAARNPNARLQVGYDSHIGKMKVLLTQTNQDCLTVVSKGPLSLLVVCDGISTANAGSGDIASSIACHVIANLWEQALPRLVAAGPGEIREFIDRALKAANSAVCEAALRIAGGNLDGRVPMGTTTTLVVVHGNWVSLAWLGDSRAYLVGPYGASILTADENQAGERLRAWHLGFLDGWDPAGFALVGYLGHFSDEMRAEALSAHHASFTLLPGESVLLCSDGVTDYVAETHPEVAHVVARVVGREDPADAAREMVTLANKGGGGDNCTCIVARLWQ